MNHSVTVNGFTIDAVVDRGLLDVLIPRLEELAAGVPPGGRELVFLAAPPGAGKSTLTAVLLQQAGHLKMQAVGIDGFHFPNRVLESRHADTEFGPVPLSSIKGAPETYDVDALGQHLEAVRARDVTWPEYDRRVHDVVPGTEVTGSGLLLVEGNWLLLDEPGWSGLSDHSSFNVFLEAEPTLLRDRLIDRKVRGGLDREAATAFYERSDRRNIERVLARTDRSKVDLFLTPRPDTTSPGGVR